LTQQCAVHVRFVRAAPVVDVCMYMFLY